MECMSIAAASIPGESLEAAAARWTVPQRSADYTRLEHATWDFLIARQLPVLQERVAPAFRRGLDTLELDRRGIPDFAALSERLAPLTGWTIDAVPGLVPTDVFFWLLAHRRFPAGRFIRKPTELDYLQEPDVFHDVFGHVPMLADPVYADYMQAFGEGGLRALRLGAIDELARLYWYTVEFGLVREAGHLRIFGAGIVSSLAESDYALHDSTPLRIGFDVRRVMRTPYAIDAMQKNYFVIDSFEDLLRRTRDDDFAPVYREIAGLPTLPIGVVANGDRLFGANERSAPA
jgi:phenylalanine-4-hydroxylase